MKKITILLTLFLLISCTSNTIYKKPKNLIPKDTMIDLLADMVIANAAKFQKNINLERKVNYMPLVYEKYHIDSLKFKTSNIYYTSKIEEYEEIFKQVENKIKNLQTKFDKEKLQLDSINRLKKGKKLVKIPTKTIKK